MANLFPPSVNITRKEVEITDSNLLSSMIETLDLDGNPITRYRFRDNGFLNYSGYFSVSGVKQAAGVWIEVTAAQLSQVRYHAALIEASENIGVQVYDGNFWSNADYDTITSIPFNGYRPVVTVANGSILETENRKISNGDFSVLGGTNLFKVTDQDGDAPVRFYFVDRATNGVSGYFVLNGVAKPQAQFFLVEASEINSLRYVGGSYGPTSEKIGVMAYDGKFWSNLVEFNMNTTPNLFAPVVTPRDISGPLGGVLPASDLFTVTDADGNSIKRVWFLDTGVNPTSGFFTVNGVQQAAGAYFNVAFRDLGTVQYHFSSLPETEILRVQAYDGRFTSAIKTARAHAILKPTVDVPDFAVVLDNLERVTWNSLFTKSDLGPNHIRYEVVDLEGDLTSARVVDHNGARLLGNRVYSFSAAEFASVQIEGGLTDSRRGQERMLVRAFNGTDWTNWTGFDVATEPVGPRALNSGTEIPVNDAPFRTITYTFMDGGNVNTSPAPIYFTDDSPFAVPLTPGQRGMMREVLAMYQSFLNVVYVEVPYDRFATDADMVFGRDTIDGLFDILAFAFLPTSEPTEDNPSDVWFDVEDYADDSQIGLGQGMRATAIHELGHSHGLKHSFDGLVRLPVALDDDRQTVMSYNRSAFLNPPLSTSEPSSIMLYDIMELQNDYGVNTTYRTGNDQYFFDSTNTDLHAFWDAGGIDTLNYTNMPLRVTADLRRGQFQFLNGLAHLLIPHGVDIENVRGGANNDSLTGNNFSNFMIGNAGTDTLVGNGGDDFLRGGAGNDSYVWRPGDGTDQIDEEAAAGRDVIEIRDIAGQLDLLENDFTFRRLGDDLRIDFTFNQADSLGSITVRRQAWGGYRTETLRMFDSTGDQIDEDIDLTSIMAQATAIPTRFRMSSFETTFGFIAQPV